MARDYLSACDRRGVEPSVWDADDTKLKDYAKVFARARLHLSGRGDEEAGDLTTEDMAAAEAFAEACRRIGEEPSFAALARLVREGVEW